MMDTCCTAELQASGRNIAVDVPVASAFREHLHKSILLACLPVVAV